MSKNKFSAADIACFSEICYTNWNMGDFLPGRAEA